MRHKLFIRYWPTPALAPEYQGEEEGFYFEDKPFIEWAIFLGERLKAGPGWCYIDEIDSSLPETFQREKAEIYLLFPSELVNLLSVTPPTKQSKHLQRAVGFMLEEQLVDDPEDLHFAIGGRRSIKMSSGQTQKVPVAVIDKNLLEQSLDNLRENRIVPSVSFPDCLLLPEPEDRGEEQRWCIMIEPGRITFRTGYVSGQAMNLTQMQSLITVLYRRMLVRCANEAGVDRVELSLEFIYQRQNEEDNPEAVAVIDSITQIVTGLVTEGGHEGINIPVKLRVRRVTSKMPPLAVICQSFINSIPPDFSLLQGSFKQRSKKSQARIPWHQAASVAVIWAILQVGIHASEAAWYTAEAQRLDQVSRELFKQINPEVKKIQSVKKQLSALLKTSDKGESVKFLPLMERAGKPIAKINGKNFQKPKVILKRMSFENSQAQLKLDLFVSGYPILDRLKLALEENGLKVEIEGASKDDELVKVKMKVRA